MKTKAIALTALFLLQSTLAGQAQSVLRQIQQAAPHPPLDPGQIFRGGGGGQPPGPGATPLPCNLPTAESIAKLVPAPKAEDIAKLVTIPVDDIAEKVADLHKAPFKALGEALGQKIKEEIEAKSNDLRDWAWEKVRVPLWVVTILTALLASMIIGLPMKALLYRVPVARDR
ncbi:hypothetical protein [Bradyrhizobium sp. BRP56]|uniref:hypothetical protein n=1 Tax=Bradyrhizobium sp. BRP56 TaxID=2793819 RepID=UPI001CD277A2|nr:hypothetical protein [Bradyrhizobium sp. BRP56]